MKNGTPLPLSVEMTSHRQSQSALLRGDQLKQATEMLKDEINEKSSPTKTVCRLFVILVYLG
jgi:protein involved in temperature-dependent protein secretion